MSAGLVGGEGLAVDATVRSERQPFQLVRGVQEYLVAPGSATSSVNLQQNPKAIAATDTSGASTTRGRHKVMFGYSLNYLISWAKHQRAFLV